ncbi:unnamed protein product [Lathyrus oleraceus]
MQALTVYLYDVLDTRYSFTDINAAGVCRQPPEKPESPSKLPFLFGFYCSALKKTTRDRDNRHYKNSTVELVTAEFYSVPRFLDKADDLQHRSLGFE